jgi:hypothetical protein
MHSSMFVSPRVAARSLIPVLLVVAFAGGSTLMAQTAQPPAAPKPAPPKPAAPKTEPSARDVPARDVPLPSARSIIDRHVKEMGGRAAILAHTSSHATGTITMTGSEITGAVDVYAAKPDKSFVRINLGGIGDIVEGFDGTHGWTLQPMTGPMLAEGKELAEKKFDADFYSDLHQEGRYASMKTVEKTTFDGRPCYKVVLTRKEGGEDIEFYDVQTGLKAGAMLTRESPMGTITATQVHSDYKKFGSLLLATTMKQSQMGIEQVLKITAIEFDNVPPSTFDPPAQIKALIK